MSTIPQGKTLFYLIQFKNRCLAVFVIPLHNQLNSIQFKGYKCLKKIIHLIDSNNEWLLLSAGSTAKFELVFVSILENSFS